MIIPMEDCQATRQLPGLLSFIGGGGAKGAKGAKRKAAGKQLPKRGKIKVDEETYYIYLPQTQLYNVTNTAAANAVGDTSTLISIDHNQDGKLTGTECSSTSMPIRIGDRMFQVTAIAADGSSMELRESASPLRGVLVGRKCPEFSYTDPNGKKFTRDDFKGSALLIDIWSIT